MIDQTNIPVRYTRVQTAEKLRERGYPVGDSTFEKLCIEGKGPPVDSYWGHRPLYLLDQAVAWAEARLRKPASAA